jgi:MFS family permease
LYYSSAFAFIGGLLIFFLGDGPNRTKNSEFKARSIIQIFQSKKFRSAAFGYFGHMWELYTFWGFVPLILQLYATRNNYEMNIPLLSFIIISVGGFSCVASGYISKKTGSTRTAFFSLGLSGMCCFFSPLMFKTTPTIFISFLIIWGLALIADSPQFSTLVTKTTTSDLRGTALTLVTSIGFAITVISLFIMDRIFYLNAILGNSNSLMILGLGPLIGLYSMMPLLNQQLKI